MPFKYTAANLVIRYAHRDRSGRVLIAVKLDVRSHRCENGPIAFGAMFLVDGSAVSLAGRGFDLVDEGDYDGDGVSELLLSGPGEGFQDYDGYVLLFDHLKRSIAVRWAYH